MMKHNQYGFTVVESLLSLIAVTIVVFVGYYVWHTQNQSNKTLNSAAHDANSSAAKGINKKSSDTTTAKYLDIKEYGVKFQLSSTVTDAYYAKNDGFIYLSVHQFDNNPDLEGCAASSSGLNNLGVVALIQAKVGQPGADEANDPWTLDLIHQAGLKQVGDAYYGFQSGNGPCYNVDSPNAETIGSKVSDVVTAFINATSTFTKD